MTTLLLRSDPNIMANASVRAREISAARNAAICDERYFFTGEPCSLPVDHDGAHIAVVNNGTRAWVSQ